MEKQLDESNLDGMQLFDKIAGHEQVMFCNDPKTGLKAIIAIHDTTMGPGLGGTRMYPYESVDDALEDVLRLSVGMTYKCAAADIDFGGAKAVIIGDPDSDKSLALFRSFGQYVDSLNGRFYTGTDMGTTMGDFVQAMKETNFVNGIPESYGGGGDSSIPTSQGVIYSLQATSYYLNGNHDLGEKTYAIQGLGKVGFKVAEHLLEEGAKLYVTDIHEDVLEAIQEKGKELNGTVEVVANDVIFNTDADVFVPCAMGGILNKENIAALKVKAVVGSANNQLENDSLAHDLTQKGIVYAPDYIVNAGGLIQVADELYGANKDRVLHKTEAIYDSLLEIYRTAESNDVTTVEAANRKCENTIKEQNQRNNFFSRERRPKWEFHSN